MAHRWIGLVGIAVLVSSFGLASPVIAAQQKASRPAAKPMTKSSNPSVLRVLNLHSDKMSEERLIRAIKSEKLQCELSVNDQAALSSAGVPDRVIEALELTEGTTVQAPAPASENSATGSAGPAGVGTPPPTAVAAPLPAAPRPNSVPRQKLRRVFIQEFDWATVRTPIQEIFGVTVDVGKGVRSILSTRVQQAGKIRVLERAKLGDIKDEISQGASSDFKRGTGARRGQLLGANVMLAGDIVTFGGETKRKGIDGRWLAGPLTGLFIGTKSTEAVVTINYRLVDVESGEQIDSGTKTGKSSRKSKGISRLHGLERRSGGRRRRHDQRGL